MDWTSRFIVSRPPPCTRPSGHTTSSLSEPTESVSSSPSSTCLLDTFRYLHPTQGHAYTCWSTLLDCRKTNFGTRIDYILASTCLSSRVLQAEVWQHVKGSDHCPVFAELDLHLTRPASQAVPSLCSDFFSGKQSNLLSFVSATPREKKKGNETAKSRDSHAKGTKRPPSSFSSLPQAKQTKLGVQQSLFSLSSTQNTKKADKASTPTCKGHNEPCVLRKVKKPGPNKDRGFWVCARPMGGKTDPQARCGYFQWDNKLK